MRADQLGHLVDAADPEQAERQRGEQGLVDRAFFVGGVGHGFLGRASIVLKMTV
jgi:hypothetical protein